VNADDVWMLAELMDMLVRALEAFVTAAASLGPRVNSELAENDGSGLMSILPKWQSIYAAEGRHNYS